MNKRQRDCLEELIEAHLMYKIDSHNQNAIRLLNARKDFKVCFATDSEDDFDHTRILNGEDGEE